MDGIKIGEILKETGVTRATVHHYVREGLLPPPRKVSRNQALYQPDCIERVRIIKGLQQSQRLSLSQVKDLLADVSGDEGLERLRAGLEHEVGKAKASPLKPGRPTHPLTRAELARRTGFSQDQIKSFEIIGLLAPAKEGRTRLFNPVNVDVADALAHLAEAGFTEDNGYDLDDVMVYQFAMRDLLADEVALFLRRAAAEGYGPEDLLGRAEVAIERVTPLILAIRRKLIQELLDAAPLSRSSS